MCKFEPCPGHISPDRKMDIKQFSKCLKDAICNLERVAVPYLGTFQAELMPASYSDKQTTINPPYRKMTFRKCEVLNEEGIEFLALIAESMGMTVEQAKVELGWCLSRLRSELEGNKVCILPDLGKMKANSANDFFFIPDAGLDIYPEAEGFEPICIKKQQPLFNIVREDAPARRPEEKSPDSRAAEKVARQEAKAAAKEKKAAAKEKKAVERAASKAKADKAVSDRPKKGNRTIAVILIVIISLLAFVILAWLVMYLFPDTFSDFLDNLLYTKEELELLGR